MGKRLLIFYSAKFLTVQDDISGNELKEEVSIDRVFESSFRSLFRPVSVPSRSTTSLSSFSLAVFLLPSEVHFSLSSDYIILASF